MIRGSGALLETVCFLAIFCAQCVKLLRKLIRAAIPNFFKLVSRFGTLAAAPLCHCKHSGLLEEH